MDGARAQDGDAGPLGWTLVATQFALLATLGVEALRRIRRGSASGTPVLPGAALILAGAGLVGWASNTLGRQLRAHPAPAAGAALRTDGAYALVRHPIYLGLLLGAAGATLIARTRRAAVALVALAALLHVKSGLEERLLAERFPDYEAYAERVPRLLPPVLPRLRRP